ncbi:MAG: glutamyl-tRNA reductase [Fluviibacter sp.]|jgi:glutamyl-tRNA reductase
MPLHLIGLNHHTAPLAIRERVAIAAEEIGNALVTLRESGAASEAAILSTCNRTELYVEGDSADAVLEWWMGHSGMSLDEARPFLYLHAEQDAVRQALRVAAGLDSMVLGEPQILGQMKDAARTAKQVGALGSHLHRLFQHAFTVAKEIRTNTGIGESVVSMAAASVHLAQRIFDDLADQSVLFVGAGDMMELCAAHFAGAKPRRMVVANRTLERANRLAEQIHGDAMRLSDMPEALHQFDIVISCTASSLPIIGLGMVERALKARRHRPLFMVDLAVPRDIEPEVAALNDVFLYTVDDLASVVQSGVASRQAAVIDAESIIASRLGEYLDWHARRANVPVIQAFREGAAQLREQELAQAKRRLQRGESAETVLEQVTTRLMNKFLHGPLAAINKADATEREQLQQAMRQFMAAWERERESNDPSASDSAYLGRSTS